MVRTKRNLESLIKKINDLKFFISNKDKDGSIEDVYDKFRTNIYSIELLLDSIESKIINAQKVFYTYLDQPNFSALNGISFEDEFFTINRLFTINNLQIERIELSFNDIKLYKESVDHNFQIFIYQITSLYEGIVNLVDLLFKKIMVFTEKNSPKNSTFLFLKKYWNLMIDYGYRQEDEFSRCINNHEILTPKYMDPIYYLRNKGIHGYTPYLFPIESSYGIDKNVSKEFSELSSEELIVNTFCNDILKKTKLFIDDFFDCIIAKLQEADTKLPL
jgi:hypothetical protein